MKDEAYGATCGARSSSLVLLTGAMGAGKSTVCLRLVELWRERGCRPAGIITRADGPRRYALDATTEERRLLAADGEPLAGPRWGRFSFSQETLQWGNDVVRRAVAGPADLVLLDEVGPLELVAGEGFLPALKVLLRSEKAVLVVVRPALLQRLRAMAAGRTVQVYEVSLENREGFPSHILRAAYSTA